MMTLEDAIREISRIKPGECLNISTRELHYIEVPRGFTPADWILENIVSSAYELVATDDDYNRCIRFRRLESPLPVDSELKTYVSPDRRHLYQRQPDGLYRYIVKPPADSDPPAGAATEQTS